MADMYCENCKRIVGTKKNLTGGLLCLLIGAILMFFFAIIGWILGPILIITGIVLIICGGKRCSICGGKNLSEKIPTEADSVSTGR